MAKPALKVTNVSKAFRLPTERASGMKQAFINVIKGVKGYKLQHVINDISFEVEKGDFFGIVGRNGSGKSTLLKLISKIYVPDSGSIRVNGKLVPFIELGVGFNPELTGRENIYMNGALLGFSNAEVDAMYDEIVSFAELQDFMDQKLKNYSSGMQVRLAFSIAIKAEGDILVLDEVLAVGDEAFQRKCTEYFYKLKREKKTVILVTHDMGSVRKFCNKAILIVDGKIKEFGKPDDVANAYSDIFAQERQSELNAQNSQSAGLEANSIELVQVAVSQNGKSTSIIDFGKDFELSVIIDSKREYKDFKFGINLLNSPGNIVLAVSTDRLPKQVPLKKGPNTFTFKIENIFTDDDYSLNIALEADQNLIMHEKDIFKFNVRGVQYSKHSLVHPKVDITIS